MKKKTVHIISHSHWDREWYLPLERHKMKLLDLIDANMELFANDPEFKSFHLDGQTIVLDDYLEVRPEKREELEKYIREGRFRVGPFYILQDEFLTSGEANVRNIQTGMRDAKK
ncbi:MAG: alpha-mannosidase, partial [Eisenbergiella sp.]